MTTYLLIAAPAVLAAVSLLFWRHQAIKNATSIDAWWALGIGVHTAFLAWFADGDPLRRAVVAALVGAWALRLAGHLYFHRVRTGVEDGRYARFRRDWSAAAFYFLYVAQGVLIYALPFSLLGAFAKRGRFPDAADAAGLVWWAGCLLGVALADRQLARFRANPANRGKTCREGLWGWSRHPNYFFEWLLWCAYIPLAAGSPYFWAALIGPSLLLFFLLKVSGVPPTEAQALASRGDDYRDYQKRTSVFFPLPPKRSLS